jgi:hypothetical protein
VSTLSALYGERSVSRNSNWILRLTLKKAADAGGGLYRVRDVKSFTFEDARSVIVEAIESATAP